MCWARAPPSDGDLATLFYWSHPQASLLSPDRSQVQPTPRSLLGNVCFAGD